MGRIVAVSNRVPSRDASDGAGGLAVGLKAALEECGGVWFGWSGRIEECADDELHEFGSGPIRYATLDFTRHEYERYYAGFANRTLWPLHHGRADLVHFDPADYVCYRGVNARFARHLARLLDDKDLVWVHDFHLIFVGAELRRLGIAPRLGFFLHVPFPSADVLSALPHYEDFINALSAYDLVGFQTKKDVYNFCEVIQHLCGGTIGGDGTVFAGGRRFRVAAFPTGINADHFAGLASDPMPRHMANTIRNCFLDCLGIIGVDRLDYTKGLPNRLLAYERLLQKAPVFRNRTVLLQVAAPSRESVPEYKGLKAQLDALSGRINAYHGDVDWSPVHYLNRTVGQKHLAHLFRASRVGFVTPLADGMNLVAKEYVAAQDPNEPGVLILSQFAGAAERLTSALIVNPYDIDGMANALRRALEMPCAERRARWTELISEVRAHDVHDWRKGFLHALAAAPRHIESRNEAATMPRSARGAAA